jgi:hypothetical protein
LGLNFDSYIASKCGRGGVRQAFGEEVMLRHAFLCG